MPIHRILQASIVGMSILLATSMIIKTVERSERSERSERPAQIEQNAFVHPVLPNQPTLPQPERPTENQRRQIEEDVRYLASPALGGRLVGEPGNAEAVRFIEKRFVELGLKVQRQPFTLQFQRKQINLENVIAWIPGSNPNEVVVIGAHLDHIGTARSMMRGSETGVCVGADDNASGTAALLAVAKAYVSSGVKPRRTICFQAYNGEEEGLKGSLYYCEHPLFPEGRPSIQSHVFMCNLDMVGYLKGEKFAIWQDGAENSIDVNELVKQLSGKYPFAVQITNRGKDGGGSDHASFYNKGVPVAFLHTGLHRYYHTPQDTPEKLDYDGIAQICRYCYDLTLAVAQAEDRPKLKAAIFDPLPIRSDHGEGPDFGDQ